MSEAIGGPTPAMERGVPASLGWYDEPLGGREGGVYGGRHVIGKGTVINKGVYVSGRGEACVVDDTRYGQLNDVYGELLARMGARGNGFKGYVLVDAMQLAREKIPYIPEAAERESRSLRERGGGDGAKITLTDYFNRGGGSRHQALLLGYLLERLKSEGYIRGKTSIERELEAGGCRTVVKYTAYNGSVDVFDPARNVWGVAEAAKPRFSKEVTEVIKRYGSALEIRDIESHVVQEHLADLALVPEGLVKKLISKGFKMKLADTDVMDMTDSGFVYQPPRGWDQSNFRGVNGVYHPRKRLAYLGGHCEGSVSMPLHEVGHAVGNLFRLDNKRELKQAHRRLYPRLDAYFQQDGPGGFSGRQEMFAQAFAVFLANPKDDFIRRYDEGLYLFLSRELGKIIG